MRFHQALREAVRYINQEWRSQIGREGKAWVAGQTATMIQQEMLGDGVTAEEIHDFVDDYAQLFLEEETKMGLHPGEAGTLPEV